MQTTILTNALLRTIYLNHAEGMLAVLTKNLAKEGAFEELRNFVQDMEYTLENPKELSDFIIDNELHLSAKFEGRDFSKMPASILVETESVDGRNRTFIQVFDATNAEDVASWTAWHGSKKTEVTNG